MDTLITLSPDNLPPHVAVRWPERERLPTLWAYGAVALIERPLVAVIGTREPSERGLKAARAWAGGVVEIGGVVLSGGAIGIDLEAHRAALQRPGGATAIVPAKGLERYTPPRWFDELAACDNWLFLTNLPPREGGSRTAPVVRNTLVAALADVVLVIEAPHRSGTAYVVNHMRRRGGPLMAVDFDGGASSHPTARPAPHAPHGPHFPHALHAPQAPRVPPALSAEGNRALLRAGAEALPERPTAPSVRRLAERLFQAHAARPVRSIQPDFFPE